MVNHPNRSKRSPAHSLALGDIFHRLLNPTPDVLMSGKLDMAIVERHIPGRGTVWYAWLPTWEGPARSDWSAARADLLDKLATMDDTP